MSPTLSSVPPTSPAEPFVSVGIVSGRSLSLCFTTPYTDGRHVFTGPCEAVLQTNGMMLLDGQSADIFRLEPTTADASFSISDVTIGVHFHWERHETQTFRGSLHLVVGPGDDHLGTHSSSHEETPLCITAINYLPVEMYLESVISSEMSAQAGISLLKAHAVISRSWLMAQIENRRKRLEAQQSNASAISHEMSAEDKAAIDETLPNEIIRWYDRDDHTLFDVCADDHCQRYQGITRQTNPNVSEAIRDTRGEVLTFDGEICDARFSKCCGGVTEEFEACWDETHYPYLVAVADSPDSTAVPDLTVEAAAERWIRSAPPAFCHTTSSEILSQVLNGYDQETTDFYRWQVSLSQAEVVDLLRRKLGIDFGQIRDLQPVSRGRSGRLILLRIVGTRHTLLLGKELEIRRALSESHLYSSAFVVSRHDISSDGIPSRFVLHGAGWGHGVGLCQIGAAVMGHQGYAYDRILAHYYPGAKIQSLW